MALKTLADYVTDESAAYENARKRAADGLAPLQTAIQAARADLDELLDELVDLRADASGLREQLAAGPPAVEAEQLALELERRTQDAHEKQLEVIDQQDELAHLDAQAAALSRHVDRAATAARAVHAHAADAADRQREQTAWATAITEAPVKDVKASADAAKGAQKAAAKARLRGADLPNELFDRAEERWKLARSRIAAVKDSAEAADAELAKQTSAAEGKRRSYELARDALREFATASRQELDTAVSLLDAVTASPPLGPDVRKRLDGTRTRPDGSADPDAKDLFDKGKAAAAEEKARDTKLADVDTARAAVDPARITAILANPDRDIESVAAVTTARQAVTAAHPASEQTAYEAVVADIDAWEAAVPDATWTLFEGYEEASATLDRLAGITPADLAPAVRTAEDAYVTELKKEGKAERVRWALEAFAAIREARAAAARRSREGRLLAALRGDSWEDA